MSELHQKIKQARLKAGLTQAQVAERLGITRGAVTLWEAENPDTRSSPTISKLKRFTEVVGVSFVSLLGQAAQTDIHESSPPQITHAEGCWSWGAAHYECACTEIAKLRGWKK